MVTASLARNAAGVLFDSWNLSVDEDYREVGPLISNQELAALDQDQPLVPKAI